MLGFSFRCDLKGRPVTYCLFNHGVWAHDVVAEDLMERTMTFQRATYAQDAIVLVILIFYVVRWTLFMCEKCVLGIIFKIWIQNCFGGWIMFFNLNQAAKAS